jgi:hypothetical protein
LGPPSFHRWAGTRQEAWSPRRCRRCLLKGCERWFTAACPQARYCSSACGEAARRWRRVQASRRYRASAGGRACRREQHRRYRARRRERVMASADVPATREGQRPAQVDADGCARMCARPGCYVTFLVTLGLACQRFCSVACRLALRRVLDRESRYRQRRRRWRRQRVRQRRQRLDSS